MRFEEQYEDVLQNLEFGIVRIYNEHPETTDYAVLDALTALRKHYIREARGQEVRTFRLTEQAQKLFDSVKFICEWRLGRKEMFEDGTDAPVELSNATKTLNEIIDCIKRVERSVKFWNKRGGRQGYLQYVQEFVPTDTLHVALDDDANE